MGGTTKTSLTHSEVVGGFTLVGMIEGGSTYIQLLLKFVHLYDEFVALLGEHGSNGDVGSGVLLEHHELGAQRSHRVHDDHLLVLVLLLEVCERRLRRGLVGFEDVAQGNHLLTLHVQLTLERQVFRLEVLQELLGGDPSTDNADATFTTRCGRL